MTGAEVATFHIDRAITAADIDYAADKALLTGPGDDTLSGAFAAIVGIDHQWDAGRFARFPDLRVVSRMGIGYDNVDLAAAEAADVVVCNAPDAPTVSTAEHTMALILALAKELPTQQARAAEGFGGPEVATALELDDATLGLIGFGRIARRVAVAGQALGMQVIATDPALDTSPIDGVQLVGLDALLAASHIVSLHAPATDATHHMISTSTLDRMRAGAYLVNCARGSLMDHDAILQAVENGRLAGVGLDVTEPEPLPAGHPLLGRPNVIVTPHVASSTATGRRRLFEHAFDNALAVHQGRPATIVTSPTAANPLMAGVRKNHLQSRQTTDVDDRYEIVDMEVRRDSGITATFADGHVAAFELNELRLACPCATCRDLRGRGERAWPRPGSPTPLTITDARFHGAWGFNITWNDQHSTGIYPFETLRRWSDGPSAEDPESDIVAE